MPTASYKPGQTLTCTVDSIPLSEGGRQTIAKLMRKDLTHKRNLRKAQTKRRQRMNVYIRGNREWTSRETVAKVVRVVKGASWTMVYTPDMDGELNFVAKNLKIS
jgi:hypothetical protein